MISGKINNTMETVTPIFLFSLPRSGSTLLQRMIATHPDVATESETWLLLPLFYLARTECSSSEYGARLATIGIEEIFEKLEDGESEYRKEVATLTQRIYAKLARNKEKYFLEKTPRYHLIANEIIEAFPEAKFIFLWRNPLAIVSSMIGTWGEENRWDLYRYYIDLYKGIENLINTYENHKSLAIDLQYEDLVQDPDGQLKRIMEYLDLSSTKLQWEDFSRINLSGTWGDRTGAKKYKQVSKEPLEKWKSQLNNPVRRIWCRRYLNWIGGPRLKTMGYDIELLQRELSKTGGVSWSMVSDAARMIYGLIFRILDMPMLRTRLSMLRNRKRIYPFS